MAPRDQAPSCTRCPKGFGIGGRRERQTALGSLAGLCNKARDIYEFCYVQAGRVDRKSHHGVGQLAANRPGLAPITKVALDKLPARRPSAPMPVRPITGPQSVRALGKPQRMPITGQPIISGLELSILLHYADKTVVSLTILLSSLYTYAASQATSGVQPTSGTHRPCSLHRPSRNRPRHRGARSHWWGVSIYRSKQMIRRFNG